MVERGGAGGPPARSQLALRVPVPLLLGLTFLVARALLLLRLLLLRSLLLVSAVLPNKSKPTHVVRITRARRASRRRQTICCGSGWHVDRNRSCRAAGQKVIVDR